MFDTLHNFLKTAFKAEARPQLDETEQLKLATAALLIQVSAADANESGDEQKVIYQRLCHLLALNENESRNLYIEAQKASDDAVSVYEFTRKVKALDYQQRCKIINALWHVAYADGRLDPQEEALIRKVADLIYLDHKDFIQTKLAAQPLG
ncbi:tellurite resistance TerB family protein [Celerinatantimonas yamalensis]|uniref:TerB family tellurite resistance protein n=1 Tax=Celerinatantimonas yamalensis TaxID=559956 RepID=A0ABW9G8Q3_9GAMM